jgi:vacuolar-type H+-ATPase subunit I/STV1
MPRLPIDYSKTIIYVIKCKDDNITEEYVGSTTDFTKRKNTHKSDCNNVNDKDYNRKIYQFIRDNGSWGNWNMIQLEEFPCKNKREAEYREEQIRIERKAQLNMRRAFVSEEQKKEQIKEQKKKYREENKEEIKENSKKWYEEHKEQKKEQQQKYREENKEQIKEQQKKYREDNKEEIKKRNKKYREEKQSQKYICYCGKEYTHSHKSRHEKSLFHTDFIKNNIL